MINVFSKENDINQLRKFAKIERIFDKIDDSKIERLFKTFS
jgi:uncharacterized protein YegL